MRRPGDISNRRCRNALYKEASLGTRWPNKHERVRAAPYRGKRVEEVIFGSGYTVL